MPEMSGPELLEQLAKRAAVPPTIFVTGQSLVPSLAHALRTGAIDYITKPVDPDRLVDSVRQALELDRRRRGSPRSVGAR
jgi:FixJ family two-component response regulator